MFSEIDIADVIEGNYEQAGIEFASAIEALYFLYKNNIIFRNQDTEQLRTSEEKVAPAASFASPTKTSAATSYVTPKDKGKPKTPLTPGAQKMVEQVVSLTPEVEQLSRSFVTDISKRQAMEDLRSSQPAFR